MRQLRRNVSKRRLSYISIDSIDLGQVQLYSHSSDVRIRQVGPVQQGDTVHDTANGDQTVVHSTNEPLLLCNTPCREQLVIVPLAMLFS